MKAIRRMSRRIAGNDGLVNWDLLICLVCLIALSFVFQAGIQAQVTSGTAVGTVTDSTHAVVPGAQVSLTNVGTGDKRADKSSATGNYQFINLPPGIYKLDVQAPGFKHFTQNNVVIQVGSSTRLETALQLGEVNQTVEVTSQAALLETQQATVGQVVEGRSVEEMPLNGRNVLNLVALAPGVVTLPAQNVSLSKLF